MYTKKSCWFVCVRSFVAFYFSFCFVTNGIVFYSIPQSIYCCHRGCCATPTIFFIVAREQKYQKNCKKKCLFHRYQKKIKSRNEATRTPDPYVPNVVRYQLRYIPFFSNANLQKVVILFIRKSC